MYVCGVSARSCNHCGRGRERGKKTISITYSECVFVALVFQRMHLVILLSANCPALPQFYKLSHKSHDFEGKKITKHKTRVLMFSTAYV